MSKTDKEIIRAIRDGKDDEVVGSLYRDVLPNIRKYIYSNNGTNDDAFDIFQDALIVFYKLVMSGQFNDEKYKIHGFIYTICKNLWINQTKKNVSEQKWQKFKLKDEAFEEPILNVIISDEKSKALQDLFQSLGDKCVEILNLSIYQKLSMRKIAAKLGLVSEDAVKVKSHRCRKMLSEKVKSNPELLELLKN